MNRVWPSPNVTTTPPGWLDEGAPSTLLRIFWAAAGTVLTSPNTGTAVLDVELKVAIGWLAVPFMETDIRGTMAFQEPCVIRDDDFSETSSVLPTPSPPLIASRVVRDGE